MIEQFVKANCLSCLLNENSNVELIPEPFRMQGTVSFRVTYQEYTRYILSLTNRTGIILMADFEYLKELASSQNPRLYTCFLNDMSFAIIKEVWFAERYKKKASVILPASLDSKPWSVSDVLKYYQVSGNAELLLCQKVTSRGFELKPPKIEQNKNLFKLAVILFYMASVSTNPREIDLVYDL